MEVKSPPSYLSLKYSGNELGSLTEEMQRVQLAHSASSLPPSYKTTATVRDRNGIVMGVRSGEAADIDEMQQLQHEIDRTNAMVGRRPTTGLFKATCSIDLLFLIDTTSSMAMYIQSARDQVRTIVHDIKEISLNDSEVRVAVVGYRDHLEMPNIEFHDFTTSIDEISRFLDSLRATGGKDVPEDVLGGIQAATKASWKQQTRCIIHIADAPAHSRDLHDFNETQDDYFDPGSEPHHLTHKPLLEQLIKLRINYTLLRITRSTDRMAWVFSGIYDPPDGRQNLCYMNKYYGQKVNWGIQNGANGMCNRKISSEPRFDELQLGKSYDALRNLVATSVAASTSRTASRLTAAALSGGKKAGDGSKKSRKPVGTLAAIDENEKPDISSPKTPNIEAGIWPQLNTPGWLDKTLEVDAFYPTVDFNGPSSLDAMMEADTNIKLSVEPLTVSMRSRPFAEGALRTASYARISTSKSNFVIKTYKDPTKDFPYLIEDMRIQTLAKAFALEFKSLLKSSSSSSSNPEPIDFIATTSLRLKTSTITSSISSDPQPQFHSLEPFLGSFLTEAEGGYEKYTGNTLFLARPSSPSSPSFTSSSPSNSNSIHSTLQAFSHFTFERSRGRFLINDLQGVGRTLTDPSIQTRDPERFKLSDTNLNTEGFKFFFARHRCGDICGELGLRTGHEMFSRDECEWEFREDWEGVEDGGEGEGGGGEGGLEKGVERKRENGDEEEAKEARVRCCENKFCRRIVRQLSRESSLDFEEMRDSRLCFACWVQSGSLKRKVRLIKLGDSREKGKGRHVAWWKRLCS